VLAAVAGVFGVACCLLCFGAQREVARRRFKRLLPDHAPAAEACWSSRARRRAEECAAAFAEHRVALALTFGAGGPKGRGALKQAAASRVEERPRDAPLRAEAKPRSSLDEVKRALHRRLGPSPPPSEEAPNALQSIVTILSPASRTDNAASPR